VRVAQDDRVHAETWQCGSAYPTALVQAPMSDARVRSGLDALTTWIDGLGGAGAAPGQAVDDATRERLRALGYMD
jgi:hypothetical protein